MIFASHLDKLRAVQKARHTQRGLILAPRLSDLPLTIQKYDDPFLPFSKAVIGATRDLVCAYVFDLAAYLALGAAGAVALERSIGFAKADGETVTILHAPFATGDYALAVSDSGFHVDGVTLTVDAPIAAYAALSNMGVYVISGAGEEVGWFDVGRGEMGIGGATIRLIGAERVNAHRREGFEGGVRDMVRDQAPD